MTADVFVFEPVSLCVESGVFGALLGAVAGAAAAFLWPRLPARWLCDYEEMPTNRHSPQARRLPWYGVALFAALCAVATGCISAQRAALSAWPTWKELLTAALTALVIALLLLAAWSDIKYTILPDELLLGAGVLTLALWALGGLHFIQAAWWWLPCGAAAGFFGLWAVLALAAKIYHTEALGFGDVKLLAVLGALCGIRALGAAVLLAVLGAACILGVALALKKVTRRDLVPFGPFLIGGALAALCLWPALCAAGQWYLGLFM